MINGAETRHSSRILDLLRIAPTLPYAPVFAALSCRISNRSPMRPSASSLYRGRGLAWNCFRAKQPRLLCRFHILGARCPFMQQDILPDLQSLAAGCVVNIKYQTHMISSSPYSPLEGADYYQARIGKHCTRPYRVGINFLCACVLDVVK
jgi:hypothetical protein